MTVEELIDELNNYDGNHEIIVSVKGEVNILTIVTTYLENLADDDDPESSVSVVISVK